MDIAQHLGRLGYKEFWLAEHHFQPAGYEGILNLLMLGLYLATQTEHLRFGCGFNITPMWHLLRLAKGFAMVDILTKGRVIFGVGRGYHIREVETFGSPMLDGVALPTLEDAVSGNTWLCGPAELIVDHLKQVEMDYPGVERVILETVMGMPLEVFKDQLTMFAEELMPAFQNQSNGDWESIQA